MNETLQLGREIAEGLAGAHAQGIVHRDIKPSNVMVTSHGHAKLLDFGLAVSDPTTPADRTHTSPVLGTPQYMSPEQACGEPVTPCADLFSFGVLLYECLAGALPFAGTTAYDYVRHLLSDSPRPLHRTAPDVPYDLALLVQRCLEKAPTSRPESAFMIVDELRRVAGREYAAGAAFANGRSGARQADPLPHGGRNRSRPSGDAWRVVVDTVTGGDPHLPAAASADHLADRGIRQPSLPRRPLGVLPVDGRRPNATLPAVRGGNGGQAGALAGGQPISQVWAPDGRGDRLCAEAREGGRGADRPCFLRRTCAGELPSRPVPITVRLLRWVDRTLFLQVEHETRSLFRLDLDRSVLVDVSGAWGVQGVLRAFDVRPDGKRVTFTLLSQGREDLWTADMDGGARKKLTDDAFFEGSPLWSGRGDTIIYRSNRGGQDDLWTIDPETGRSWSLTSSPTQEVPDSTSADGALISYQQDFAETKLWFWDLEDGTSRQLTAGALNDFAPVTSSEGKTIAFQRRRPTPSQISTIVDSQILVGSFDASTLELAPKEVVDGFAAKLSPDGAWLTYLRYGRRPGRVALELERLETGETTTLSVSSPLPANSPFPLDWVEQTVAWSPSGAEVYFIEERGVQALRRHRIGEAASEDLLVLGASEFLRDVYPSPDGRELAYLRWSNDAYALHVLDLNSGADRKIGRVPGDRTRVYARGWTAGGSALILVRVEKFGEEPGLGDLEVLRASTDGSLVRVGAGGTLLRRDLPPEPKRDGALLHLLA